MTATKPSKPAKRKPQRRPVYFRVAKLMDPATGEVFGCLVPRYPCDARAMRESGYKTGSELRAELKKPRNAKFHRLAHAIGGLMVDQVEGFEDMDAHGAFKKLQGDCGACCEPMELDLGTLGKVSIQVPRSIAFDEMDEGDFHALVRAIYDHIAARYWPTMTPAAVEEMALMYERDSA